MTLISLTEKDIDPNGNIIPQTNWEDVTALYITSHPTLTNLTKDKLPPKLEELSLGGCKNIKSLSDLPETIIALDLNNCEGLTSLSITALTNLKILNLSGCNNIEWTPQLMDHLQFLENNNCKIIYPDDTKIIKNVWDRIEGFNPDNPNLYNLFHHYFTENLASKIMPRILSTNIILLLDIIDQNPQHKILAEKIAEGFADDGSDTNRNVSGFFELATWLLATKQENVVKKLEALMPLMVNNAIANFAELLLQQEGQDDPFARHLLKNAFLKEIHTRLLEDGRLNSGWFGVPQFLFQKKIGAGTPDKDLHGEFKNIVGNPTESRIGKFLTKENIDLIYKKVVDVLVSPSEKNIDQFLPNNSHDTRIWSMMAFPDHYQKIESNIQDLKASLLEASDGDVWFKSLKISDLDRGHFDKIIELTKDLILKSRPSRSPSEFVGTALATRGKDKQNSEQQGQRLSLI